LFWWPIWGQVFELALAIFMMLLTRFKQYLKMQIEVFLKDILFSMLETSLSSFRHKWLVMVTLSKITNDPQIVIDLYLNYDCDEYLANVFERMINNLSRVAQGRASSELGATPQQEGNMKVRPWVDHAWRSPEPSAWGVCR
jgi:brefeldin A-inhibited guanine nucleotide-exchange protein